jgi:tripeptidyl-peptidase-1
MSTPGHRDYGKHFQSHDEMKRMLQPSEDSLHSVQNWLEDAGVKDVQRDADWLTVHTTVEKANDLLDANFQYYVNRHKHVERLRTLEYSLPKNVIPHVNVVSPTTRFGQLKPNRATMHSKAKAADAAFKKAALSPSASCDTAITPECLKSIYNVGDYKPQSDNGNKVAFASYLEQYARYEDLALFEKNLAPYANGDNFTVIEFHGGGNDQNSQSDSSEANLDLQTIVGLSSPVPVTEFSTGGRGPLVPDLDQPDINNNNNEPYLDFLQNVVKMSNDELPQVISTSYGEDEQVNLSREFQNS